MPTKEEVTVDFDHHRLIHEVDPDEAYEQLRRTHPVAWTNAHGGYWVVTRYEDVYRVMREYKTFSSRDGMAVPPHPSVDIGIPVHLDPPLHSAYRRAMNPYMTREAVQVLKARIQRWTTHYVDQVIEKGECDLAYDLCVPIPGAVTLEWIGWEQRDEWDRISVAWHDLLAWPLDHPRAKQSHKDLAWFSGRIAEEIEARRAEPRDDILSYVANLEIDGETIDVQRAVAMTTVWVAGGVDTATTFMLGGLQHLHYHHAHRQRLIDEPEIWDSAMDELIRRYAPTRTTARTVLQRTEIGDVVVEPGDRILVGLSAANLDAAQFPDPFTVDFERHKREKHMSFGAGVHKCVGMHLGRQEFREIVGQVLRRMPDYSLVEERIAPYERQSEMRGWTMMPAVFTPGAREGAPEPALVA